ncbi:hypothetical protein Q5752_002939 [Cryptotrichosporon argae]
MPRRRVVPRRVPPAPLDARVQLFTYAISRLPPRQLPFLALYAYAVVHAAARGWIDAERTGKAAAAIVGVLSMVTGLLLSYRFSSAMARWDEGKKVWTEVRVAVRDGLRLLCTPSPVRVSALSTPADLVSTPSSSSPLASDAGEPEPDAVQMRTDELAGLLLAFPFALQHHLHGTRPLPQAPLCDLLPAGYLASLKRTEARVRFADEPAGLARSPSAVRHVEGDAAAGVADKDRGEDELRPGLRRRPTGPPSEDERRAAQGDVAHLRQRAEDAVARLAEAVAGDDPVGSAELAQQLEQLNLPPDEKADVGAALVARAGASAARAPRTKSNLHAPQPGNLALAILRLMDTYTAGLAERAGWTESKRERALGIARTLNELLGSAERLATTPPPLPLTLHLSHLLILYLVALPPSLLSLLASSSSSSPSPSALPSTTTVVTISLVAGWALLGLDALVADVSGVFGESENHHPLPRLARDVLREATDAWPALANAYRARLVARLGNDADEVRELERTCRRRHEDDWVPAF